MSAKVKGLSGNVVGQGKWISDKFNKDFFGQDQSLMSAKCKFSIPAGIQCKNNQLLLLIISSIYENENRNSTVRNTLNPPCLTIEEKNYLVSRFVGVTNP